MSSLKPNYSSEEIARRGDELYEREVRPGVEPGNHGKVVAIDVTSGGYAVADNAVRASQQVLVQHPEAVIWLVRIGYRTLHRIGRSFSPEGA